MSLSKNQVIQLALECGFEEYADCVVTEDNSIKEVDTVYMGDTASLAQFAEQILKLKEQS